MTSVVAKAHCQCEDANWKGNTVNALMSFTFMLQVAQVAKMADKFAKSMEFQPASKGAHTVLSARG